MAGQQRQTKPAKNFNLFWLLAGFWLILLAQDFRSFRGGQESIAYSQFLQQVDQGQISEVFVGDDKVQGVTRAEVPRVPKTFVANRVEDPQLAERLNKAGVKFTALHEPRFLRDLMSWALMAVVFVAFWSFIMSRLRNGIGGAGPGGMLPLGKSKARVHMESDLKTRFTDVAGVDEAKEELKELVSFLRNPADYSKLGGRMPKGVLLVGPPGTGKTLMARAVAGEAGVPFFSINGSEFVELFVGLGAARVRDLFEQARAKAPCIIFIDELDAIGKSRGIGMLQGSANDEKEQTLNQLLAEIDGFDPSIGVVILGATNRPEVLDPALLRAGRFDRTVLIDKPDRLGRTQILLIHMKKVKLSPEVNPEVLSSLTAGFSGADLANLVNEAALIATRRSAESIELKDFTAAIERIVAGLERKNRVLHPDEKRRVAYHEMGHTVVALARGSFEAVHKVSIIPRGIGALGYTLRRPTEDRYLMSRNELKEKMAIAMGGRAAEEIFLGEISTGAADDLDKATDIARAMVTRYGMSAKLGLAILESEQSPMLGQSISGRKFDFSDRTAEAIDEEIQSLLSDSLVSAHSTIEQYREFVEEGARFLLASETIDEAQLKEMWARHVGPVRRIS